MLTTFTGALISLIISAFSPCDSGEYSGKGPNDLNYFNSGPQEKELSIRPLEALGGGFKKN